MSFRIEIGAFGVKLRRIRQGPLADSGPTCHTRGICIRMVEEHWISDLHLLKHEVSSLVVSHSFPKSFSLALKVGNGIDVGFGFHQPMLHTFPDSVLWSRNASLKVNQEKGVFMGYTLITGASAGIGEATARKLVREGRQLLLVGRRIERLQKLVDELGPNSVQAFSVDVSSAKSCEDFFRSQEKLLRQVDTLINNAGLALGIDKFQNAQWTDWETMIDTNIKGLLRMTRALVPMMIEQGRGDIVNLGSVAGRWSYPGGAVYCATKFAVRTISESLRMDLLGTPLRVINIEPGMVESEFSIVRLGSADKAKKVYEGMTPLSPEDIAECISWTLSRPRHVNIQEMVVFPTDQAGVGQVHRSSVNLTSSRT